MNILLVEDSKDDAQLLRDFLSEEPNAPSVHWVVDGREAINYLSKSGGYGMMPDPDVILLDLALPRFGGLETLRALKGNPEFADIPVIVITTSYNPLDEKNCRFLGAAGFYSKPSNLQGYEDLTQKLMRLDFPRVVTRRPEIDKAGMIL